MAEEPEHLRKQAWDFFALCASQRMTVFNFYIVLSSITATTYFASFKDDSHLEGARPFFAGMLCLFAFVFWKLDRRTNAMINRARCALRYFEQCDPGDLVAKVFTRDKVESNARKSIGWQRILFWRLELKYSECLNLVFLTFFVIGLVGLARPLLGWIRWMR